MWLHIALSFFPTPELANLPVNEPATPEVHAESALRERAPAERTASLLDAPGPYRGAAQEPLSAPDVYAREGWYLNLGFGLTTTSDSDGPDEDIEFDEGYAVPIALGRHYGSYDSRWSYDVELEGIWTDQDADDDGPLQAVRDVSVIGALLNGVLHFGLSDDFGLYGGAGLGAAWLDVGTESDSVNDFDDEDGPFLAWQAKAGLRWWASDSLSWNVGYRFLNIDDAEIDDGIGDSSFDLETQQHILEIGLRLQL